MAVLTEELVLSKTKCDELSYVKNLNLWGNDLRDVSILRKMPSVEVLSLSVNKINSLKDFANCKYLSELYMRKNEVRDLKEISYLSKLKGLKILWLCDNPCADDPQYRQYVIQTLPQLQKLDNTDITAEEQAAASRARATGAESKPPRENDATPHHRLERSASSSAVQQPVPYERQRRSSSRTDMRDAPAGDRRDAARVANDDGYVYDESRPRHQPAPAPAPAQQSRPEYADYRDRNPRQPTMELQGRLKDRALNTGTSRDRSSNILYSVLYLLDELDHDSLQIVRSEIDEKFKAKPQR